MTTWRFKDTFPTFDDFKTKVITPIQDNLGDVEWLKDQQKYYKVKALYFMLNNAYANRTQYHSGDEFLGYFNNIFIQVVPTYFARVQQLIADQISELKDKQNAGIGSTLSSKSMRGQSTSPFGNYMNELDNVDNQSESLYDLTNSNENLIEIAARMASIKINGEVQKFVASFAQLFTKTALVQDVPYNYYNDVLNEVHDVKAKYDELYKYYQAHPNNPVNANTKIKEYTDENEFMTNSQPGDFGWTAGTTPNHLVLMLNNANNIVRWITDIEIAEKYLTKTEAANTYQPLDKSKLVILSTFAHLSQGIEFLVGQPPSTWLDGVNDGDTIKIDISAISTLTAIPADGRLYVTTDYPVTVGPSNYMEYDSRTNPGDEIVRGNEDKIMVVKVHSGGVKSLEFVRWETTQRIDTLDYMDDSGMVDLEGTPITTRK